MASVLGSGWAFPVIPTANGALALVSDETRIKQSIWLILATAKGERVMLPTFGCGIHDLVFQPNTVAVRGSVKAEVNDALTRWEPRIDVIDIDVSAPSGQPAVMQVDIWYRIRATNSVYNLVYPLFMSEGLAGGLGTGGALNAT